MPGMPGSLALCSTPPAMTTKRAESRSLRLVVTIQRLIDSSHTMSVVSVWKSAFGYISNVRPRSWQYSKISDACAYFRVGM
jgi:hypothetical protein